MRIFRLIDINSQKGPFTTGTYSHNGEYWKPWIPICETYPHIWHDVGDFMTSNYVCGVAKPEQIFHWFDKEIYPILKEIGCFRVVCYDVDAKYVKKGKSRLQVAFDKDNCTVYKTFTLEQFENKHKNYRQL